MNTNRAMASHVHSIVEHADKALRQKFLGESLLDLIRPEHAHPQSPTVHQLRNTEALLHEMLEAVAAKRLACESQTLELVAEKAA